MQKPIDNLLKGFKIGLPLLLLICAGIELIKMIKDMNFHLLYLEWNELKTGRILIIFLVALCAVLPMVFYDLILLKALSIKRPFKKNLKQAFIVNTVSNFIGFGGIAGLLLRSYFYSSYKKEKQTLIKDITTVTLFTLTGMSVLAWIILLSHRDLIYDTTIYLIAVIIMALYLPFIIGFHSLQHKRGKKSLMTLNIGAKLVLTSLLEWLAIFLFIWFISISLQLPIQFHLLFPIFIVASCAGILSMIPGGMGSFDVIFLWGLESVGVQNEQGLVLLIFYRIGYYLIPFLLSSLLFIKDYTKRWRILWKDLVGQR
ncbi:lysylphosphatidylglycerol synthase domain-containing protein [Bacillus niameyensis]|uniref:lysylphosphatidylglycerol synthase domain-containing protein n=1 Tax=Bacillus niameyensis TaxID=1522308 RepID=UPI0007804A59|nr:lysylphosphatidylglycerol synthase domain-containing protein [Bacillus niameyensis]